MMRCLSLGRKNHEHGGYDGTHMCGRRFVCYFSLIVRRWQAVLRAVCRPKRGWFGVCFVFFNQGFDRFFVVSCGGREARAGELIAFQVLVFVGIHYVPGMVCGPCVLTMRT